MKSGKLEGKVWNAGRVNSGELISFLYGPCEIARRMALVPARKTLGAGYGLQVDLGLSVFLDMLSGRDRRIEVGSGSYSASGPGALFVA